MDNVKSESRPVRVPKQPNPGRRSFMWRMGAAVSAVLASAVPGKSVPAIHQDLDLKNRMNRLSNQLEIFKDERAIRRLHQTYESLLNGERYEEVASLFTDDGEVIFNGGVFKGKSKGISRLYGRRFKSGLTGRSIESPPAFQPDPELQQDSIEIAPDRKSARARFSYSIQVGIPMIADSSLVEMARLHGEGIMKWWEGGTYEASYVRRIGKNGWKIKRLEYRTRSKADYRPGKSHAGKIYVPAFSKLYPEDPDGPDLLAASGSKRVRDL